MAVKNFLMASSPPALAPMSATGGPGRKAGCSSGSISAGAGGVASVIATFAGLLDRNRFGDAAAGFSFRFFPAAMKMTHFVEDDFRVVAASISRPLWSMKRKSTHQD
jgi:hypothetical protein